MPDSLRRLAPLTGVVFAVTLAATFILTGGTPGVHDSGAQVITYYKAHHSKQMAGNLIASRRSRLLYLLRRHAAWLPAPASRRRDAIGNGPRRRNDGGDRRNRCSSASGSRWSMSATRSRPRRRRHSTSSRWTSSGRSRSASASSGSGSGSRSSTAARCRSGSAGSPSCSESSPSRRFGFFSFIIFLLWSAVVGIMVFMRGDTAPAAGAGSGARGVRRGRRDVGRPPNSPRVLLSSQASRREFSR